MIYFMPEVVIRVEVPEGMQNKFEKAIEEVLKKFIEEIKWSVAQDIISKSKLDEEIARKLAVEVKNSVAKKHGV
ncbi:MAG: hypothetical protein DRN25_00840 [Thermoplasmata archaeon]|nr:MAG: hypothetical protein DRN25_00840 [Thermoplasmata archaeon]